MTSEIESRIESIRCTIRLLDANANGEQWLGRANKIREFVDRLALQLSLLRGSYIIEGSEVSRAIESRWYKPWTWKVFTLKSDRGIVIATDKKWVGYENADPIGDIRASMGAIGENSLYPWPESRWYKPWTWHWVQAYGLMRIRGEEVIPNEGDD